jgi:protein TonB
VSLSSNTEFKKYSLSLGLALVLHVWIFFISTSSSPEELEVENLIEVQLLNEIPAPKPTPPQKKAPPPPVKKVIPKKAPKEVIPQKEEIAEEEKKKKKVEEQTPKEIVKPIKIKPTKSTTPTKVKPGPQVVDSKKLDNSNFKPFGNKKPIYPSLARKSGVEGWVKVKVLVSNRGKVIQVEVIDYRGHPSFKEATITVAKKWRFPAPIAGGKRIKAWYTKKVGFKIRD